MRKDEIISLAREAGFRTVLTNSIDGDEVVPDSSVITDQLERFAALVAAREREALSVVTPEIIEAGCEVLYGHPRENAIEWAKEDKFDGKVGLAKDIFTAQMKAAIRSRSTD